MIALFAAALAVSQPLVTIQNGRLAGELHSDGVAAFWGIPFARRPVGQLRWKPPQREKAWSGVRDATRWPAPCAQPNLGWNSAWVAAAAEDCLYLNVKTPDLTPVHPLPVIFSIPGGGNEGGSAGEASWSSIPAHGIVVVTIQYRLGVFGFMSHPALSRESPSNASGNYGLMDQQAALKWVRSNIARFGGDPQNITIIGGSAGAHAVGLFLVSRGVRGLFQKAIEESGTPQFGLPARSLKENEAIGEAIATKSGAPPHPTAAQLREIPAATLMKASAGAVAGVGHDALWAGAVVDGLALTESPAATLARGRQARVPLLIGANTREIAFPIGDPADFVRASFGANADKALGVYGLSGSGAGRSDNRFGSVAMQITGDLIFRCPAVTVARAQARTGAPVWLYLFGYTPPGGPSVTHGSEEQYTLNGPGESLGSRSPPLRRGGPPLQSYWINFVKTGDPNGPGLAQWPRFSPATGRYIDFTPDGPRTAVGLREAECSLVSNP